jgi:methylthioribulose 1-phosphate dehydratase/enolase-phosphatase E1
MASANSLPSVQEAQALVCELCRHFYSQVFPHERDKSCCTQSQVVTLLFLQGWVSGTGGGITVLSTGGACIAPSSVQKERMQPHEIFLVDLASGDCIPQPGSSYI